MKFYFSMHYVNREKIYYKLVEMTCVNMGTKLAVMEIIIMDDDDDDDADDDANDDDDDDDGDGGGGGDDEENNSCGDDGADENYDGN